MRAIKFRGKTPNGETVYGDLTRDLNGIWINDRRVKLNSVAQFCGLDANDEEIYEGDTVIAHGKQYTVSLTAKYGIFTDLKSCRKF